MKIGFYAGSFDPFTNGHLNVVREAAAIFDKIVIGIAVNPDKKRRYDKTIMKAAIEKTLISEKLNNVSVVVYDELTADVAKNMGATHLIRGLRNSLDYVTEEDYATANKKLCGLDTIYFRAGDFDIVSSTLVFELLTRNKDVSAYIPKDVFDTIKNKR